MSNTHFCLQCGQSIGTFDKVCRYCGQNQFGENNDLYPDERLKSNTSKSGFSFGRRQKEGFSDEEILALGLYPKDEGYKMSLISRILGRK